MSDIIWIVLAIIGCVSGIIWIGFIISLAVTDIKRKMKEKQEKKNGTLH